MIGSIVMVLSALLAIAYAVSLYLKNVHWYTFNKEGGTKEQEVKVYAWYLEEAHVMLLREVGDDYRSYHLVETNDRCII